MKNKVEVKGFEPWSTEWEFRLYLVNQQCCSGGNYPQMEGFLTKFKIENMSPQETPEIKH